MKIPLKEAIKRSASFTKAYKITDGNNFKLSRHDPADLGQWNKECKDRAGDILEMGVDAISALQARLYADSRWAVLLVLQAMDAAGKDGIVKHVFSGVNPQGCRVTSFKSPSSTELRHDYLWRCSRELPERGYIGIFNRSYYEEVLSVRVHKEFLEAQNLPETLRKKKLWENRYNDINNFERYLNNNAIVPVKVFLHLSREEQKKRFLSRIDDEEKNWKFSESDVKERGFWDDYQKAIERMIRKTATREAPWFVVPADNKWYARVVVMAILVEVLARINPQFPDMDEAKKDDLLLAKEILEDEEG